MKSVRDIIFTYFEDNNDDDFSSLLGYLDTDTIVAWFVDEDYLDNLDDEEEKAAVSDYYDLHC